MTVVEQVKIWRDNSDGKGDYHIINKRDMKPSDKLWPLVESQPKKVRKKAKK